MKKISLSFLVLSFSFWTSISAMAEMSPEAKGLEIAKKANAVAKSFGDQVVDAEMVLKNRHGQKNTRLMKIKTLEVKGDGDKSLVIFKNPKDVKGTAFLSFTHKTGNDDQWLYLPKLRRVKRISSNNKSGPFVGSEFSYEDISSQEVEKYKYKYIKNDKLGDKETFVVEQYPVDKNSGYTRQVVWIDKKEYIPLKIDFYDRKEAHLKTLEFKGYKKYKGRHWRADIFSMQNHQSGKSTVFTWKNYEFDKGFKSRDFDKNSLKRAR